MKRKLKFLRKSVFAIVLLAIIVNIFTPLKALAEDSIVLTITIEDNTKFAIEAGSNDQGPLRVNASGGGNDEIRVMAGNADISNEVTYECTSQVSCSITVTNRDSVSLDYHTDWMDITEGESLINTTTAFTTNKNLVVKEHINNNQGNEPHFDGRAFVVWSCKSGICFHEFGTTDDNRIPSFDDGNSTFYKDTDITDDKGTGETFDINAKYKGWYLTDELNFWAQLYQMATGNSLDPETLDPKLILGDPNQNIGKLEKEAIEAGSCQKPEQDAGREAEKQFENCINQYAAEIKHEIWTHKLRPVGEPSDNNGFVSYGDRNFKVVIYNEKYRGITIGDLSDLNYYPAEWSNPFIRQDQFDISGTTKDKPTYVNAILLEKTINIKTLGSNGFEIGKLEALDVPSDAVSIDEKNGEWKIIFSSNFYDKVVFKATEKGENGGEYYFAVKRSTVDAWINNVEGAPHYYAEVYYDRNNTYNDFDLSALIVYKNGFIEKVKLTHYNKIDDGLGNISTVDEQDQENPEFGDAGKGLKKAVFIYKLPEGKTDRDIKVAYTNIEYKGSTADKYAGAFAGSGKGILANIYQGEE